MYQASISMKTFDTNFSCASPWFFFSTPVRLLIVCCKKYLKLLVESGFMYKVQGIIFDWLYFEIILPKLFLSIDQLISVVVHVYSFNRNTIQYFFFFFFLKESFGCN